MAKAKRQKVGRAIVGGVNTVEIERASVGHAISGKIEKRRDDRLRLRLGASLDVTKGQRLLVEAGYETVLAIVAEVHPHNLIDVDVRGGLDRYAHAVKVRRVPL